MASFDILALLRADLWQALWLTIRLASLTTLLLILLGIPLAYWLVHSRSRFGALIETLVSLPIVLPPTVIGFYLLIALSPQHTLGRTWFDATGSSLAFSFSGLVIGSIIYSLPFAVQPFMQGFKSVRSEFVEAAASLGANARQRFWTILLPESRSAIAAGATLSFAHTIGEFGVVLMIGGNIAGETRVASIALYDETQKLDYASAHAYAVVLLVLSFALLLAITLLQRRSKLHTF